VLRHRFLGREDPLICGLVLTNRCNLRCRHCRVAARGAADMSFGEVQRVIDAFYERGGRCLYLEGGEPFLWRDGRYRIEDVVEHAQRTGFYTVIIYTNGTVPLETSADTVFVSIDGLRDTHDDLRGPSFDRILANIHRSGHPSLFVNFTINSRNKGEIEAFCSSTGQLDQIRGVFFYFHTPYYGYDDLYIDAPGRNEILRYLLACKRRFRILNSAAGLRSALRNDWKRPLSICSVYENGRTYPCCRFSGDPELCRNCGYLSYAEINETLRLRPSAIFNALKYF
jgi:MoaA/NifB/PqqE/SkfB family radical SAM enzyme